MEKTLSSHNDKIYTQEVFLGIDFLRNRVDDRARCYAFLSLGPVVSGLIVFKMN